jgi:hypothetical protein
MGNLDRTVLIISSQSQSCVTTDGVTRPVCLHVMHPSGAQGQIFVTSPAGHITIFYRLRFETQSTWRARSPYLYPPGTQSHFRRLLRLAGRLHMGSNVEGRISSK